MQIQNFLYYGIVECPKRQQLLQYTREGAVLKVEHDRSDYNRIFDVADLLKVTLPLGGVWVEPSKLEHHTIAGCRVIEWDAQSSVKVNVGSWFNHGKTYERLKAEAEALKTSLATTKAAQQNILAHIADDLGYYHEDYWLGYKYACSHEWELRHMFTSSYERCKKCGEERDCP